MSNHTQTDVHTRIRSHIRDSLDAKQRILDSDDLQAQIVAVAERCITALRAGHKIIFAGNGGSAADAQHLAAELLGRFEAERDSLAATTLTTNVSSLTAIANDYSYDAVFARQLAGIGRPGDVFIAISTSGNSKNLLLAIDKAHAMDIETIGFCGEKGAMLEVCHACIRVPASRTAIIQESHIMIGHIVCGLIESAFLN